MLGKTKVILTVVSALAVGGIGIAVYKRRKNRQEGEPDVGIIDDVTEVIKYTSGVSHCSREATFPLAKGSKGFQVGELQRMLNVINGANLVVDCNFGRKTEKELKQALKKFNKAEKTTVSESELEEFRTTSGVTTDMTEVSSAISSWWGGGDK